MPGSRQTRVSKSFTFCALSELNFSFSFFSFSCLIFRLSLNIYLYKCMSILFRFQLILSILLHLLSLSLSFLHFSRPSSSSSSPPPPPLIASCGWTHEDQSRRRGVLVGVAVETRPSPSAGPRAWLIQSRKGKRERIRARQPKGSYFILILPSFFCLFGESFL